MGWLARWNDAILNSCLEQDCLLCDAVSGSEPVCRCCADALPSLPAQCPCCAQPSRGGARCGSCVSSPPAFDATVAKWSYAYPADRLVQALKYHGRLQLAGWFARQLQPLVTGPADVWIAVPLHATRLVERGFNQAVEIARRLAPADALLTTGIRRTRATAPQAALLPGQRSSNVRGTFACDRLLAGRSVMIVDDVMTTGATLNELARTLKAAGAARVTNLVVARTLIDR
jgi:ComF family protein